MVDSPSGRRMCVISRVAGLTKVSARFPFSSESTATYVPLGETFAVFTFAERVNIARPVGSDEAAGAAAGSACLQDATRVRSASRGMRRFIDVFLLRRAEGAMSVGVASTATIRAGGARSEDATVPRHLRGGLADHRADNSRTKRGRDAARRRATRAKRRQFFRLADCATDVYGERGTGCVRSSWGSGWLL